MEEPCTRIHKNRNRNHVGGEWQKTDAPSLRMEDDQRGTRRMWVGIELEKGDNMLGKMSDRMPYGKVRKWHALEKD